MSESFDQAKLDQVWQSYIEAHRESATDMEQLIFHRELKVKDEKTMVLMLRSALETSILERFEHDMVVELRQALRNDFVVLEKEVVEEEEQTKKLYTNADKFEYMSQQNPQLKELKDRLGLDFDY